MYRTKTTPDPVFTDVLKLELVQVEPSLAGPKRPQDRVALKDVKAGFTMAMDKEFNKGGDGEGLRAASVARHLDRQELRQGRRPSAFRSRAASTTSATATW